MFGMFAVCRTGRRIHARTLLQRLIFDSLKPIGRYKEVEMSRAVCYVAEDHVCLEHFASYPENFK